MHFFFNPESHNFSLQGESRRKEGDVGAARCVTLPARTFISAINSSFFMFCFSVTRMPFSSRIVLQRGSTLSLISTEVMEIGAMSIVSPRAAESRQLVLMNGRSDGSFSVLPGFNTAHFGVKARLSVHLLFVTSCAAGLVGTSRLQAFRPESLCLTSLHDTIKGRPTKISRYVRHMLMVFNTFKYPQLNF